MTDPSHAPFVGNYILLGSAIGALSGIFYAMLKDYVSRTLRKNNARTLVRSDIKSIHAIEGQIENDEDIRRSIYVNAQKTSGSPGFEPILEYIYKNAELFTDNELEELIQFYKGIRAQRIRILNLKNMAQKKHNPSELKDLENEYIKEYIRLRKVSHKIVKKYSRHTNKRAFLTSPVFGDF